MRKDGFGLNDVIGGEIGRLPAEGHSGKVGRLPADGRRLQGPDSADLSFMDLRGAEPDDIETTETQQ